MRISSPPPPPFAYGAQPTDQPAARRAASTAAAAAPARTMTVAQLVASENRSSALTGNMDLTDATLADFASQGAAKLRRTDLKL